MQAICPEPRKSDCYHLIVNLLDRFLGYREPKIEELPMIVTACAMISLKLRRATQECLSYQQLRYYFSNVSEQNIRVSVCVCVCVCVSVSVSVSVCRRTMRFFAAPYLGDSVLSSSYLSLE